MDSEKKNPSQPQSVLEALGNVVLEMAKKSEEIEARKSPEQRAREAEQSRQRAEAYALEKVKKEQSRCDALFRLWLKRDTWLIYDEAMPLTKAEKPDTETIFNLRDENLWVLVQSCAGHSLQIINLDEKPNKWRVVPFEWVRWLKLKEQVVHPQLEELLYPNNTALPSFKTTKAIQTRETIKRDRQKAIKDFALKAEELAIKNHQQWNRHAIPVTKLDFLKVFGALNPAYKKINMATFDRDIVDIGLKFKRGTSSNKNNMLNALFRII